MDQEFIAVCIITVCHSDNNGVNIRPQPLEAGNNGNGTSWVSLFPSCIGHAICLWCTQWRWHLIVMQGRCVYNKWTVTSHSARLWNRRIIWVSPVLCSQKHRIHPLAETQQTDEIETVWRQSWQRLGLKGFTSKTKPTPQHTGWTVLIIKII